MFRKILIANRGEIACRVIRTAKNMGIRTVAVYSDVDASAMHVEMADEAYVLGAALAQESYLNQQKIIDIALRSGVEAIHPGYGFLSENAEFCRACQDHKIKFIGPDVAAIEAMGSKARAKDLMANANVPLVPGYQGDSQDSKILEQHASKIGFPLLIKASAGGGGKGMRLVQDAAEFESALLSAKREASQSFGDDHVILEKYLANARHVEVQIFCDQRGGAVYLGDRDCSMQRRHQKILEEAPAPNLSESVRRAMGEAAVRAALAIHYCGAGTVEFLLENDRFYFMEMNTRLQVEHPVTELVTGLDLVEWQLKVAADEILPLQQEDVHIDGHAIEARIYAEDCDNGFVPSSGQIKYLHWPQSQDNLRIDTGVRDGDVISSYYDPMIAKLIVWGPDRQQALGQLESSLLDCQIAGLQTNLPFLSRLQACESFRTAKLSTHYVDSHIANLQTKTSEQGGEFLAAAACVALLLCEQAQSDEKFTTSQSPWDVCDNWRMNLSSWQTLRLVKDSERVDVQVHRENDIYHLRLNESLISLEGRLDEDRLTLIQNGYRQQFRAVIEGNSLVLFDKNRPHEFIRYLGSATSAQEQTEGNSVCAPMHGRLIEISVSTEQVVNEGDPVAIVEAMKMEHTLRAPFAGRVVDVLFQKNDIVEKDAVIVALEKSA